MCFSRETTNCVGMPLHRSASITLSVGRWIYRSSCFLCPVVAVSLIWASRSIRKPVIANSLQTLVSHVEDLDIGHESATIDRSHNGINVAHFWDTFRLNKHCRPFSNILLRHYTYMANPSPCEWMHGFPTNIFQPNLHCEVRKCKISFDKSEIILSDE
jgi:hypothetical protein